MPADPREACAFGACLENRPVFILDPCLMNVVPGYFHRKNRRKTEPKEIPSFLIPCLLAVFTRQLKILVTSLAFIVDTDNVKVIEKAKKVKKANIQSS